MFHHLSQFEVLDQTFGLILFSYTNNYILTVTWSHHQNHQDECSFVSLRDIDRALIVLKFFHEKLNVISPEMKQLAEEQGKEIIQVRTLIDGCGAVLLEYPSIVIHITNTFSYSVKLPGQLCLLSECVTMHVYRNQKNGSTMLTTSQDGLNTLFSKLMVLCLFRILIGKESNKCLL